VNSISFVGNLLADPKLQFSGRQAARDLPRRGLRRSGIEERSVRGVALRVRSRMSLVPGLMLGDRMIRLL
jgi:hypothetical protein